ncbi:MAG TPA: CarD family transcriptional regulator, partial [Hyphomicrobiales bacterium]|nr:CarD family transcriptional regulator [Hyphomicrobiales bacterium]
LYEAALDRMAREVAAVGRLTETEAIRKIEQSLAKSPKRGEKAAGSGEDDEQDEAA